MSFLVSKITSKLRLPFRIRTMADDSKAVIEKLLCHQSEIQNNCMKEFEIGPDNEKILIVKQSDKLFAVGSKCTHYGAPLANGALGNGRVRCPWHGACFNLETGDIEDFPGLDSLPCFKVSVTEDGHVKVRGTKNEFKLKKRVKQMTTYNPHNRETIVIIGGGVAASTFVETVRQEGFNGGVIMVGKEQYLPYDRVKVDKQMDSEYSKIVLRSQEFYDNYDIDVKLGQEVTEVDMSKKVVKTAVGECYNFTKLFIACGGKARRFGDQYFGNNLKNIFVLRSIDDANAIYKQLSSEKNVIIVGTSFIGMEAASFCNGKVKSITVCGTSTVPFKEALGEKVGKTILDLYESKGIVMKMNTGIKGFEGADGVLTHVVCSDGTKLPADICIGGIGIEYDTKFLAGTGIATTKNGTVEVDEYLTTNIPDIYAGGDVANAPVFIHHNQKFAIGHFQLAQYHGHIAALNALGKCKRLRAVPFFFSMIFGKGIRYAGFAPAYDDVVITGSLDDFKFAAYYCNKDNVLAVATIAADPIASKFAEFLYDEKVVKKTDLSSNEWIVKV